MSFFFKESPGAILAGMNFPHWQGAIALCLIEPEKTLGFRRRWRLRVPAPLLQSKIPTPASPFPASLSYGLLELTAHAGGRFLITRMG
jgi:hypothetical protein